MPEMYRSEKLVTQDNPSYILHLHVLKTIQVIFVVMKLQFYSKWELPSLLLQIKVLFKKNSKNIIRALCMFLSVALKHFNRIRPWFHYTNMFHMDTHYPGASYSNFWKHVKGYAHFWWDEEFCLPLSRQKSKNPSHA